MSHESITIEELATRIGRDRREVEKLAHERREPFDLVAVEVDAGDIEPVSAWRASRTSSKNHFQS